MSAFFQLTFASVISIIVFSLCFAVFLVIVMRNNKLLSNVKYELLLFCLLAPILRLAIPIEVLPWSHNINIAYGLPQMSVFLHRPGIVIDGMQWSRWQVIWSILTIISIVSVLYTLVAYMKFLKDMEKAPKVKNAEVYQLLDRLLEEKGKKATVTVRWTDCYESPCVFGIFKPTILLPQIEFDEEKLEHIFRHELAHYLHGDLLIRLGWKLIKAFCWWNPAVYILDKQLERLLEIRADENALKKQQESVCDEYMMTLVVMGKNTPKKKGISYGASYQEKKGLTIDRRIRIIMDRVVRNRLDFALTNVVVCACVIVLTVAMNCLIFEPLNKTVESEERSGSVMVSTDNSFLVKNAEGTYDMYYGGVFCTTLESGEGTGLTVYESLEEAMNEKEIK